MQAGTKLRPRAAGDHAVVLGASMAGLAAARVLADAYGRVSVVDRDLLPAPGVQRRGVPQGRHAHGLLARGREALEELFPGLTDELVARGALYGDVQLSGRWYNEGVLLRQAPSGLNSLAVSRPLLEGQVRRRLAAFPNVSIVDGCDVAGLVATPNRHRVTGIRTLRRRPYGPEQVLEADLVVDATGRGSRSPAWLTALGYEPPEQETVRPRIAYASAVYRRRPAEHLGGDRVVIVAATHATRHGAAMLAMEDDRWIVTLFGYMGERPPTDPDGFRAWAASLSTPDVHEVIAEAELLQAPVPAHFPASVRLRYERLDRFPEGYAVTGDAVCSFNPVYGQGMTVSALEALALRDCLRDGADQLGQRFFRSAAKLVDIPWGIAVGADLRFPEVEGPRTPKVRMINAYLARLHVAAGSDPVLGRAFLRVVNLIDPPEHLMSPELAFRVMRGTRAAS
jgi:2-polyprenyl-6-methoxyphenol hydroxylase-like FAD-dependent oxidoreductase